MRYKSFSDLVNAIKQNGRPSRCAVVGADDQQTIQACVRAWKENLILPILIGNASEIEAKLLSENVMPSSFRIINQSFSDDAAQIAIDLVHAGEADCIMKGQIETGHLMHVVMKKENNMRSSQLISALSVLELPFYHKLLFMSDAGICMYPDLNQKKGIIENAVQAMTKMGIDIPKVAVLCAVEYFNPKMPETVEAAALKEMNQQGELTGCIVEGPISYDVALYKHAADQKGFDSLVAGDPDLLLWPNITCGNIASKILDHSVGGKGGGLVLGTKVPIILTSRGDDSAGKYRCIILAAAYNNF